MSFSRQQFSDYYRKKNLSILEQALYKSESLKDSRYTFKGEINKFTVVVRCDLNGYSTWSHDKKMPQKIHMLDSFFSTIVPLIDDHNGIYYREEGDCIIALFSPYFTSSVSWANVISFCRKATSRRYGTGANTLTIKTIVNCGDVTYFQKTHEQGSNEWSAEGYAFIQSARFEHAVESEPRIYLFEDECDNFFIKNLPELKDKANRKSIQIPGLKLPSGWQKIAYFSYSI